MKNYDYEIVLALRVKVTFQNIFDARKNKTPSLASTFNPAFSRINNSPKY